MERYEKRLLWMIKMDDLNMRISAELMHWKDDTLGEVILIQKNRCEKISDDPKSILLGMMMDEKERRDNITVVKTWAKKEIKKIGRMPGKFILEKAAITYEKTYEEIRKICKEVNADLKISFKRNSFKQSDSELNQIFKKFNRPNLQIN